jgi:hypothetical protein
MAASAIGPGPLSARAAADAAMNLLGHLMVRRLLLFR